MRKKKMYRVEKFLPTECPKCRHPFMREGDDYVRLLGDIVEGEKRVRETQGYIINICAKCQNYTAFIELESYQLGNKKEAERLVREEGFRNLIVVTATGTHCQDMHAVHAQMPGTRVIGVRCDEDDA